jgi:hypothetical protein
MHNNQEISRSVLMNHRLLAIPLLLLFTGSAVAELIQSTTGVYLTSRQCVKGVTACDSITRQNVKEFGGLPGSSDAHASIDDPAYGEMSGGAKLTGDWGSSETTSHVTSLPGARNGSNNSILQRYANKSEHAETLTVSATLSYELKVPSENAEFSAKSGGHSAANADMEIFSLSVESIEAGTTVEDNNYFLMSDPPEDAQYNSLVHASAKSDENVSGAGSESISISVVVEAGDSVWLWVGIQGIGANGAVVDASLATVATIKQHVE